MRFRLPVNTRASAEDSETVTGFGEGAFEFLISAARLINHFNAGLPTTSA
jgi:hypothetical protein